jgi:tellurite methyltransferase
MDERERWNAHYASRVNTYEGQPHAFLREHLALLPRGRALELAMGEGYNAIFLARQSFSVTGIDISPVAVERSLQLGQEAGVAIDAHCMDLRTTTLPAHTFDIVAYFYYLQRDLLPQVMNTLKTGGMVIYETFTGMRRSPASKRNMAIPRTLKTSCARTSYSRPFERCAYGSIGTSL